MHGHNPTPEQACGACADFEPARNEPAHDIKYGYCKPHLALEAEKSRLGVARAMMVDVTTSCFMSIWHGMEQRKAFRPKPIPSEPQ